MGGGEDTDRTPEGRRRPASWCLPRALHRGGRAFASFQHPCSSLLGVRITEFDEGAELFAKRVAVGRSCQPAGVAEFRPPTAGECLQ